MRPWRTAAPARPAGRQRPLCADQAGDRGDAHRRVGAAGQDGIRAGVRRAGRGCRGILARRSMPPYAALFDWAAKGADPPRLDHVPLFRPFMLAHPLEEREVDLADYAAEWKWDGIRVQIVHAAGETRRLFALGRRYLGHLPRNGRRAALPGGARRRIAGARQPPGRRGRRRGQLQRLAAAAGPQDRVARRCCASTRPSSGSTMCCCSMARICAN